MQRCGECQSRNRQAPGAVMGKTFTTIILLVACTLAVSVQSNAQAAPAAPPPVHHSTSGQPTAIIETTVGNLTCTLFPDKAPIEVENFIGLATGTKDWKNPMNGVTKHGVP